MSEIFGSVPVPKKGRTNFNESHSVSGSFPMSQLIPVFCTETIPGDRWDVNVFNLTKLETLIAPAMQRIDASLLWFKIPKRLLFRHFKKWYSGGEDGQDTHEKPHFFIWQFAYDFLAWAATKQMSDAQIQYVTDTLFGAGSLWQYLGLPVPLHYNSATSVWDVSSMKDWGIDSDNLKSDDSFIDLMYLMGYHMLYDQYFRDQTLSKGCYEDSEEGILKVNTEYNSYLYIDTNNVLKLPSTTGSDLAEGGEIDWKDVIRLLLPYKRAWKKDYFTSAQPNAQRGPEVTMSITGEAPVTIPGQSVEINDPTMQGWVESGTTIEGDLNLRPVGKPNESYIYSDAKGVDKIKGTSSAMEGTADLTGLSPITITAFRNLFKLQAFLEKNNVAGGRFIETILAHWAERVPDFTVQRAQHIRSTSIPVQISEVYATANTQGGVNTQVGDQGGIGRTRGNLGRVHIYTQEPCIIYALYNVTCPPAYANQGIHRMFQRRTRFDEPWRDFQHIGEQAIKTREIYFDFLDSEVNNDDFGYQQRFSEFKYMPDRIVGDFQTSLAYWHMARMFSDMPALNEDFVTQNLDERIFAVQSVRPVIADFFFDAKAKRKLSKFSTPKLT